MKEKTGGMQLIRQNVWLDAARILIEDLKSTTVKYFREKNDKIASLKWPISNGPVRVLYAKGTVPA